MAAPDRYALFGNPVEHSRSPWIHAAFARQCEQDIEYRAVHVETGAFAASAGEFFADGGRGLNITVPFKEDAFAFADQRAECAERARAANTLRAEDDGQVYADNTDGVGLLRDIKDNLGWAVTGRRVLLLGAGGAVRGVLALLLAEQPGQLVVVNRTASRAVEVAEMFADLGPLQGGGYELLDDGQYDLIINGTSGSLSGDMPPLPDTLIAEGGCCYDMMYSAEPTVFMRWASSNGARAVADGLGMLVEQAAESFRLWRDVRPDTAPVLADLRAALGSGSAPADTDPDSASRTSSWLPSGNGTD